MKARPVIVTEFVGVTTLIRTVDWAAVWHEFFRLMPSGSRIQHENLSRVTTEFWVMDN